MTTRDTVRSEPVTARSTGLGAPRLIRQLAGATAGLAAADLEASSPSTPGASTRTCPSVRCPRHRSLLDRRDTVCRNEARAWRPDRSDPFPAYRGAHIGGQSAR